MRCLIVMVAFGSAFAGLQAPGPANKDAAVYEAILSARIRPEVDRFSSAVGIATPAPVLTFDRTLAICRSAADPPLPLGCIREDEVQSFETKPPRMRRAWFQNFLDSATRQEIARSFRFRNRETQPFPGAKLSGLIVVSPPDVAAVTEREVGRTRGVTRFSLPAYSGEARALVYGSYVCGGFCGEGWLFLLERQGDGWRVVATESLWIS